MSDGGRLYAVLGVGRDASPEDIKKAFRKIARTCHPDVAGDDAAAAERFKEAREAYETLVDEERRRAYDAADRPRPRRGRDVEEADRGAFFRAFYRRASGGAEPPTPKTHGERFTARAAPAAGPVADTTDDLFSDFGFGVGSQPGRRARPTGQERARRGDDVVIELEVPASVARDGGTVTAHYARLARVPAWTPEAGGPGVQPCRDPVELDVPAGTRPAAVRRYRGLGDAGDFGGPAGDLVVRFRVVADPRAAPPPPPPPSAASAGEVDGEVRVMDVTIAEALLGGRLEVQTPSGKVRVALPPCTSSGRRLRLTGRGAGGGDLLLEVRIVAPERLDDRSRALIEEFARLNPEVPAR